MATAAQRMYYAMLGGTAALPTPPDLCPPYTMPAYTAADGNLADLVVLASHTSADANLCEELL